MLEPSTAWVVEAHDRPVGYLVATLDTRRFVARWREQWTPVFADRMPAPQWIRRSNGCATLATIPGEVD